MIAGQWRPSPPIKCDRPNCPSTAQTTRFLSARFCSLKCLRWGQTQSQVHGKRGERKVCPVCLRKPLIYKRRTSEGPSGSRSHYVAVCPLCKWAQCQECWPVPVGPTTRVTSCPNRRAYRVA